MNHLALEAESKGFAVVVVETPEKRSLPALLIPALRSTLLKLNHLSGLDLGSEPGIADSGDLESDLVDLFIQLGMAAKEKHTAFMVQF